MAELELDFGVPTSSTTLYRACVKDIVDGVEHLSMRGVRLDQSEDGSPGVTKIAMGRSQGESIQPFAIDRDLYYILQVTNQVLPSPTLT